MIKISRKKHTQPPSSLPSGREESSSGIYPRQSRGTARENMSGRGRRRRRRRRRGSKLKVAKWRYWVSRGARRERRVRLSGSPPRRAGRDSPARRVAPPSRGFSRRFQPASPEPPPPPLAKQAGPDVAGAPGPPGTRAGSERLRSERGRLNYRDKRDDVFFLSLSLSLALGASRHEDT